VFIAMSLDFADVLIGVFGCVRLKDYAFQVLPIGFLVAKLDFSVVFMMEKLNEGRSLTLFFLTEELHFYWVLRTGVNFAFLRHVLPESSCLVTF
jgi:hypothetical protein